MRKRKQEKIIWNTTWLVLRPLLRIFCGFRISGIDNIKSLKNPCIFAAATHSHILDSYIIGTALPFNSHFYPIRFMAKDAFFKMPLVKHIVGAYGAFPVIRGLGLEKTLKPAIEIINHGYSIGMFIEGKISPIGKLRDAKPGAAALAQMTGAPIIPVAIKGTHQIRNPLKFLFLQKKISVSFGQPIETAKTNPVLDHEIIAMQTKTLSEEIKNLSLSC